MLRTVAVLALASSVAHAQMDMGKGKDMKSDKMMMGDGVEYTIIVKGLWTAERFPLDYPAGAAHFSGIIGLSHTNGFAIFKEGAMPTPGLEHLSEMGAHSPLDAELKRVIASGKGGMLVESGPLKDFANDSIVATIKVDDKHPLLSFVAMVAPSPDWFTGLSNLNLMENGSWTTSKTVELYAWDSGGDDGTTYKAADVDNNPKKPTMQASPKHFAPKGTRMPVAMVTVTRK